MKILIPNATGPLNIGDQAILKGLLSLIVKKYPGSNLLIHSSDPSLYNHSSIQVKPHLYFWSVFENTNSLVRIFRISQLFFSYISIKLGLNPKPFISSKLADLLDDYNDTDKIIIVGGGYLRSQKGLTQSLNLLMILAMFMFSKIYKNKTIVAPLSFGPFAYKWQEKISARVLNGFIKVFSRGEISYQLMERYGVSNLVNSYDTAFLLDNENKTSKTNGDFKLGFTIRKWMDTNEQEKFEKEFAGALIDFSQKTNCEILPIVQVFGFDDDTEPTKHVVHILKSNNATVLDTIKINSVDRALEVYGSLDMLLGMRMHSNIIAAVQNVPFVAISYEHKTDEISKCLEMSEYCIDHKKATRFKIYELLNRAYDKNLENKATLEGRLNALRKNLELSLAI